MGTPQCLTLVHNDAGEQIVYGDSKGAAIMLLCGSREWPARDMISGAEHQDYVMVHQVRCGAVPVWDTRAGQDHESTSSKLSATWAAGHLRSKQQQQPRHDGQGSEASQQMTHSQAERAGDLRTKQRARRCTATARVVLGLPP